MSAFLFKAGFRKIEFGTWMKIVLVSQSLELDKNDVLFHKTFYLLASHDK